MKNMRELNEIELQVGQSNGGADEDFGFLQARNSQPDFSELVVKQLIEVFEFILGSLSNTASYLRLWALSLAHSQLSEVFYSMSLETCIEHEKAMNFVLVFLMYVMLAVITFGILMCIDVLECFLHSLRLHWIEFQNKFYEGAGHLFSPISYRNLGKAYS